MAELDFLTSSHQLERKAKQTAAVWPLSLPRGTAQVWPGQVCSVAGLEARFNGHFSNHSAEVELTMQNDQECEFLFHGYYSRATQICVGDLKMMKNSFKVMFLASTWIGPRREQMGSSRGWE